MLSKIGETSILFKPKTWFLAALAFVLVFSGCTALPTSRFDAVEAAAVPTTETPPETQPDTSADVLPSATPASVATATPEALFPTETAQPTVPPTPAPLSRQEDA